MTVRHVILIYTVGPVNTLVRARFITSPSTLAVVGKSRVYDEAAVCIWSEGAHIVVTFNLFVLKLYGNGIGRYC